MTPYFYIIEHKVSGRYYAGAKWAQNADPTVFWVDGGYFTSSKVVNELIQSEGKDSFVVRKLRVFSTPEEVYEYETKFLRKVRARSNPIFINEHENDGFTNLGSSSVARDKMKKTNLHRHGVEHNWSIPSVRAKIKQTLIETLGVDHQLKSSKVKEQIIRTSMERYGYKNPAMHQSVKARMKDTNLERRGCENPFQDENVKNGIKQKFVEMSNEDFSQWAMPRLFGKKGGRNAAVVRYLRMRGQNPDAFYDEYSTINTR
jgi:hypothetical protein